jgi:hypothetical protein
MVRHLCYAGVATFDKTNTSRSNAGAGRHDSPPGFCHQLPLGLDMDAVVLESEITCPNCRHSKREIMPTDRCQVVYECTQCKVLLRPYPGECCVFCSFGSMQCPSMQSGFLCHF